MDVYVWHWIDDEREDSYFFHMDKNDPRFCWLNLIATQIITHMPNGEPGFETDEFPNAHFDIAYGIKDPVQFEKICKWA